MTLWRLIGLDAERRVFDVNRFRVQIVQQLRFEEMRETRRRLEKVCCQHASTTLWVGLGCHVMVSTF